MSAGVIGEGQARFLKIESRSEGDIGSDASVETAQPRVKACENMRCRQRYVGRAKWPETIQAAKKMQRAGEKVVTVNFDDNQEEYHEKASSVKTNKTKLH